MRSSDKAVFATLLFLGMTPSSFAHYGHHGGGGNALVEILSSTSVAEGVSTTCSAADRYKSEIREMRNVAVQYLSDYEESPTLADAVSTYERKVLKIQEADQAEDLNKERVLGLLNWLNTF